ncbi:uncharacterized protein LOC144235326 [Crocuta crocuta]
MAVAPSTRNKGPTVAFMAKDAETPWPQQQQAQTGGAWERQEPERGKGRILKLASGGRPTRARLNRDRTGPLVCKVGKCAEARPGPSAASSACSQVPLPREQSRGALPGPGHPRRAARTTACAPREARTPSRQNCAPPLPAGPGERLASPPPFPPPRPVSPPSPRATGGGGGGGGRSGPSRGSPDLARCDVANQRGPKLRAQPETQLEPGPQPKSKPQPESVASEPGADEPRTQRNPRGAVVRSGRWRATERIPGKARRHRGSTRSSFLRPAHGPSCRRLALPRLPGEPTPASAPGIPRGPQPRGREHQPCQGHSSPRPSQPLVAAQAAGNFQERG